MRKLFRLFISIILAGILFYSCIDEKFTKDPTHLLSFSTDTLSFDTLFSTIASRTKSFLVYNKNKRAIRISSVRLAQGATSCFRVNVNGKIPPETNSIETIDIKANDSLYIFVELTLKDQNSNFPILINDAVLFETNGQAQRVQLKAYGQDAIIFKGKKIINDSTLTGDRPYLIFDYLQIAKGKTLTLQPGTKLFFHNSANLIIDGNLLANGTLEHPVVLRGDRFDTMPDKDNTPYAYFSGQWGSVLLRAHNAVHTLKYVNISGGTNGIIIDGNNAISPSVSIENSTIHMMSSFGVHAKSAKLSISNTEISNCGKACLRLVGGENSINHCTIANYYEWATREVPAVVVTNYTIDGNWKYLNSLRSAVFQNSILFGSLKQELSLEKDNVSGNSNLFNIYFSHCQIKSSPKNTPEFNHIIWSNATNKEGGAVESSDVLFVNTSIRKIKESGYYNFRLKKEAEARNNANVSVANLFPTDKNGENRFSDGKPDIGAYEWIQK